MLKVVTMEQGDSASDHMEYTVIPPSIVPTFKGSDEGKNVPQSCSLTPTSPTPCSSSSSSNRTNSVETTTLGPHSVSSRQSSSHSSVVTNTSGPHSASSRQSSSHSSVITDTSGPYSASSRQASSHSSVITNTSGPYSSSSRQSSSHSSVKTDTSAPQSATNYDMSLYFREDSENDTTSCNNTDNTSLVAQPHGSVLESGDIAEVRCAWCKAM